MERMVYNRLNWYLESHSMLAEEQAGFRKFKSTAHHVTIFSQAIKDALDSKQVLTAIAVDLKSAYDTVWKENLLFKLNNMGISGHLLNWIKSFFGSASLQSPIRGRNWPLEKIIEEKALVLWEKILRTPRYLTLRNLKSPSQHCLKTQAGFLQEVLKLKDSYNLNSEFENLPAPRNPLDCLIFNVVTDLVPAVR
ncbi:reverse transcriptase domain-containing protein [Caerostris darwini]|uniref:Reverse transcriptase domain-containing protein n=1 Tax=Caerostris darwini TaxID=1538125 RepID=A0AAV4S1T2_9ARAC|nr:reverse transcriptase domain-containing protein [Caerostris darwini]